MAGGLASAVAGSTSTSTSQGSSDARREWEPPAPAVRPGPPLSIFPYGVSRNYLEQSLREMRLPVRIRHHIDDADLVLTLKNYYRRHDSPVRAAESSGIPIHVLRSNTVAQIKGALARVYGVVGRLRRSVDTVDTRKRSLDLRHRVAAQHMDRYPRRLGGANRRIVAPVVVLQGEHEVGVVDVVLDADGEAQLPKRLLEIVRDTP